MAKQMSGVNLVELQLNSQLGMHAEIPRPQAPQHKSAHTAYSQQANDDANDIISPKKHAADAARIHRSSMAYLLSLFTETITFTIL